MPDISSSRRARAAGAAVHTTPLRESNRASGAAIMPSSVKQEKRRRIDELTHDDDDDEGDESVASSRRTRKSHRTRPALEEEEEEEGEGEEDDDDKGNIGGSDRPQSHHPAQASGAASSSVRSSGRDKDGFHPGAIVRVKLQRFVTYDSVEFNCGPHLNMVIGPNGTGKSSICCAIALGLGWRPAILGRSKDVAAFVKHGYEDAVIEVELKAARGNKTNFVLERKIFRKDNKSEWRLNGQKVQTKDIIELVDSLDINVGNLCCFLPQDKVADFARMSPSELLKETQKAAGNAEMTRWHEKLIECGVQQREVTARLDKEREEVINLEQRNEVLHRDVRRAEERKKIEEEIALLDLRLPFAQYSSKKKDYDECKLERNQMKEVLMKKRSKIEPLSDRLAEMETNCKDQDTSVKAMQKTISNDTREVHRLHEALEEQGSEAQKHSDQLDSVRKKEQERRKVISQLTRTIAELVEAVKDEPPRPDNSVFDVRLRTMKEQVRNLKSDEAEAASQFEDISGEIRRLDRETDDTRRKLAQIDNVKNARLEMLRKADPDTAKAVEWLRQNLSRFREPVHEPILMELSIESPRFASAVEGSINWVTMRTFVCQTREDYDLFTREVIDGQRMRVNVAEQEGGKRLEDYEKPATEEVLGRLGFERYVLDCIDGPDAVLRYLCETMKLHQVPLASGEGSVDVEAVEKSRRFQRYIAGSNVFTITYSNYGSRLPQTMTRTLRPARTFTNSVDQALKRQLESRIQEIGVKKAELEQRSQTLTKEESKRSKRMEEARKQMLEIEQEKGAAAKPRSVWEKMMVNLNSKRETLQREREMPTAEEETRKLRDKLTRVNEKSWEVVKQIMAFMQRQVRLRSELDEMELISLHDRVKLSAMAALKRSEESDFEEARQALEDVSLRFTNLKEEALTYYKRTQDALDDAPPDLQERFNNIQDELTLDQIQSRLAEENAKLSMMIEVRPGVMEEYNKRRRQIEELNHTIQKLAKEKMKADGKVEELESKWVTALEAMVSNVSARFARAFQAIGNAGEVRIARHPDYNQWGIEIMVKFRDNEQLQLLTASRQSGGERSISTITYLLSLTELSRSPFSLVDEINQGMDQKYERQVHNHMVNVTCRDEAGQYFLITPKLLPNLSYHEQMKILVVNNGEWLPETGFDFTRYIRKRKGQPLPRPGRVQAAVTA